MTDHENIVNDVLSKMKEGSDDLDILIYVKERGIEGEEYKEVVQIAKSRLLQEKLKYLPKRNKIIFTFWFSLTIIVFIIDVFFIPQLHQIEHPFFICLLGSATFIFCLYLSFLYNMSWKVSFLEHQDKPKMNFSFLPLFLMPGGIVYFIIFWRFNTEADKSLAQHLEKATGTIISGHSFASRRFDFSEVTVAFKTKEGEDVVATEDISKYVFKKFYNGQNVELVYSSLNPRNIDLLTDESNIKEITGSDDRAIYPKDLLDLMGVNKKKIGEALDKITFGWVFNEHDSVWVNARRNIAFKMSENTVVYITAGNEGFVFQKYLKELGFKPSTSNSNVPFSRAEQLFESDLYMAVIQFKVMGESDGFVITIIKK